ncbi:MAG: hypothetical protein AB7F88_16520 [Pyrinomonadaceae bacterium]
MNKPAISFAPAENTDKRLKIELDGGEAVLKLSSWVEGLGWCGEKTMRIGPELLDEMHRMTGAARVRLRQQRVDGDGPPTASARVLRFPFDSE